ncbi:MAG: nucleoside hydrolase [Clostridia bacterium]|nr:nucleoside hydrolase [Clostridia bacterium]
MEKILLDTDIGSDIDDAVCLAYLLSNPECELMGVTTVSGEPVKRAMLASVLCRAAKKEIPIYPGVESPLFGKNSQPLARQADAIGRWSCETEFPRGEAVEFLRKTIRRHPGEITLLAIGPMTNIALLFSVDPEIPSLLKQLVLMCGVFTNRLAGVGPLEWNALCDPHATSIVYNAPVRIHRSIGLDVTCQVTMSKQDVEKNFTAEILRPVKDFTRVFFESFSVMTFHDPLAAVSIFAPGVCSFEHGNVEVELGGGKSEGMTFWTPDREAGRHEVALGVDKDSFFRHYFSVVNR